MTRPVSSALLGVGLFVVAAEPAAGVIRYASPDRNTSAPTGDLAASGWQYQGHWGSFLGTPIGPNHFITAEHIGGNVGGTFQYNGANYTTNASFDDPATDLRIWRVNETFPTYAPLYTAGDEIGEEIVVFGRGTQRGAEVHLAEPPRAGESTLRGWRNGPSDGVQSWGINTVSAFITWPSPVGQVLAFHFEDSAVPDDSALTVGDSGGGVFVRDRADGVWKLAGINYGIDGPWRLDPGDASFHASLFDMGNVYFVNAQTNANTFSADEAGDMPAGSYATRIAGALPFIESVVPEPGAASLLAAGAVASLLRRRRRRRP